MSILRRTRLAATALIVGSSFLVMSPAGAAQAYEPGTAKANGVKYNGTTGAWDYSCSYAKWRSGAKVSYNCKLYHRYYIPSTGWTKDLVSSNPGSWTPSPASRKTPTYHHMLVVGEGGYCVEATALSVDGGVKDTSCT